MQCYFPSSSLKRLEKTRRRVFTLLYYCIIVLTKVKHKINQCFDFTGEPNQKLWPHLSCLPIRHLETPQGKCSALLSERKLTNLENSDVKTTSVEQTVPRRHREWWKEKESTITVYEAHCRRTGWEGEAIGLSLWSWTHTHMDAHEHRDTQKYHKAELSWMRETLGRVD